MVWGMCGHAFHLQCINKCLATQEEQRCPFCRRPWEFKVLQLVIACNCLQLAPHSLILDMRMHLCAQQLTADAPNELLRFASSKIACSIMLIRWQRRWAAVAAMANNQWMLRHLLPSRRPVKPRNPLQACDHLARDSIA